MKRRILSALLALSMVLTMLPTALAEEEGPSGTDPVSTTEPEGSWYNPDATEYVIDSVEDLQAFAVAVNNGDTFIGKTVKLGADLDLSDINWTPIGGDDVYFAGEFDGQGYAIKNLTQTTGARMGLFGLIEKAYIHDLTLSDVSFTVAENNARVGAVAGNLQYWNVVENVTIDGITMTLNGNDALAGAVSGYVWKSQMGNVDVEDAEFIVNGTGNVIGGHTAYGRAHVWDAGVTGNNANWLDGTVQNINGAEYVLQNYFEGCDVDGIKIELNGSGSEAGGFFGSDTYNSHSNYFVDCHVTGLDVTAAEGTSQIVGGFIAWNNGTTSAGTVKGFDGCSATGTITGANGTYGGFSGQVGGRACEYYNASADVDITCSGTAGGFVGATQAYSTHKYTFTNCTAVGDVIANVAGGFVGKNGMSGDGKSVFVELNGCSASGAVSGTTYTGGLIGEVNTELPATNWNIVDSTGSLTLVGNTASEDVTGGGAGALIGYFDGVANGDAKEGNTVEVAMLNNSYSSSLKSMNLSGDTIEEDIFEAKVQVGGSYHATVADALGAAEDGDVIELLEDVVIEADLTINKDITVTGAEFSVADGVTLQITAGTYEQDVRTWVPDGYTAVQNIDGTWTVTDSGNVERLNIVIYRNGDVEKAYTSVGMECIKGEVIDLTELDISDYYTSANGFEFEGWFDDWRWNLYKAGENPNGLDEVTVNGWTNIICMVTDYENIVVKAVTNDDKDNAETISSGKALMGFDLNTYLETVEVSEKTGYTLDKWYNWDWYGNKINNDATVNGWTNVYVTYTANQYDVTLDPNDGTDESASMTVTYDQTYGTLPTPTREGYKFLGWFDESGNEVTSGTTVKTAKGHTLTAKWTINQYTITFDTNGGSAIDPITADYGTSVTAPKAPTKTGYTFNGWDKEIPATMPAEDLTITAQWTANQYTITFDTDGGSDVAPITVAYGTAITAPAAPTKTGYTFAGWVKGDVDFIFTEGMTMGAENITLTAKWNPADGTKYTVYHKFEKLDGTYEIQSEEKYGVTGAETAAEAKNVENFTAGTIAQSVIAADGSTVVEIIYTRNTYTVTFDSDKGSAVESQTVKHGATATEPDEPTRRNYEFEGWYLAGELYNFDTPVTEDITLVAQWDREYRPSRPSNPTKPVTPSKPADPVVPDEPEAPEECDGGKKCPSYKFVDVNYGDWFHEEVDYVLLEDMFKGMTESEFAPNGTMTRAMVWTVLARMEGVDVEGASPWYAKAQTWAMENEVSDGTAPNNTITREQLVTMLWRSVGEPSARLDILARFEDNANISGYAVQAMAWAVENGILEGDNGNLKPQADATRAEVAAIMMRFCELNQ